MSAPTPSAEGSPVRPAVAAALATVGFGAVSITGFAVIGVVIESEPIPVPGLGPLPGAGGMLVSVAVVALGAWRAARRGRWSGAFLVAAGALLGYLAGVAGGAIATGADPARAIAAVGGFATSWFALLLTVAAGTAGMVAVALATMPAARPTWRWEGREDDEES